MPKKCEKDPIIIWEHLVSKFYSPASMRNDAIFLKQWSRLEDVLLVTSGGRAKVVGLPGKMAIWLIEPGYSVVCD